MATEKPLYRSRDSVFGGVCAGVADYFGIDAVIARIIAVVGAFFSPGSLIIAYIALWAVLSKEADPLCPCDVNPQSVQSERYGTVGAQAADKCCARAAHVADAGDKPESAKEPGGRRLSMATRVSVACGIAALFLLLLALLRLFVRGVAWWQFWPLALSIIGMGVMIMSGASSRRGIGIAMGALLIIAGVSALPISIEMCSIRTLQLAVENFWPLLLVSALFFVVGCVRYNPALLGAAVVCFAVFCYIGLTQMWIPGSLEMLSLDSPFGHKRLFILPKNASLVLSSLGLAFG